MRLERKIISLILVVLLLITSISVITTSTYANSYEKAMFIMEHLNITQGVNGSFSHKGTNAIDIAGKDSGIDSAYAPFTGTVKRIYQGYVVWFESNSPVLFADGSVDYMTIMVMHDNDTSDLYVGKTIKQGEHFFDEGTAGYATGNHIHLECGKGKFQGNGWYKNSNGQWMIYNSVLPYDALYLSTGTVVKNNYNYPWKNANDSVPSFTYDSIENGEYYLKNVATGKYLAVDGGKDAQAQNVSVADFTGGNEMKFKFVSESNGYALKPLCSSSRMLNIYADTVVSGKNVCIYDNTGHSSQRWRFEAVDGGYIIHSSNNLSCVLDVNGNNVQVSSNTGANSQKWVLEPIKIAVLPDKPILNVAPGTSEVDTVFTWEETANTDSYTLHLYNETEDWKYPLFSDITDLTISISLPAGDYSAFVASINDDLKNTNLWYTVSDTINFSVVDTHVHDYVIIGSDKGNCQTIGCKKYICGCGDSYIVYNDYYGDHVPSDEWTVLKTPTETTYGIACKLCTVCNTQLEFAQIDINGNFITSDIPTSTVPVPPEHTYPLGYEMDAYIADKKTGDVMFTWDEHNGAAYYNVRIINDDLNEIVNENVYEPCFLWSPTTTNSGMISVASYDTNGKMFAQSALVGFEKNEVNGDWWGEYGDVDCNSKINIKDATLIQKYSAKLLDIDKIELGAADVNADKKVNIKDATAIQKYLAKIKTNTKVGESYSSNHTDYSIKLIG